MISGYHGHRGFHGKRSADAEPGYVHAPCEKVTKEICKSVPVKADVSKDIESCTEVAKEVRIFQNPRIYPIFSYLRFVRRLRRLFLR